MQSCPSTSEATLKDIGKMGLLFDQKKIQQKRKHNISIIMSILGQGNLMGALTFFHIFILKVNCGLQIVC